MVMIIGNGIDHVELSRFKTDMESDEFAFLARVFTDSEIIYAKSTDDYVQRLAGRFAAKEVALKALGTGWAGSVDRKEIETTNEPSGQARIKLTGVAAKIAESAGAKRFFVSISHTSRLASAEVIIET